MVYGQRHGHAVAHSARAPLWRISRYDGFQLRKIDELVGLSSELVGDHGRLCDEARHDTDAFAPLLMAATKLRKSPSPENSTM